MFGSNKNYEAYSTVHFSEEGKHLSAEELYQQKTDQYYYMLDRKGKYFKTIYLIFSLIEVNGTNKVLVKVTYEDEAGEDFEITLDPTTSKVIDTFGSKCVSFDLKSYGLHRIRYVLIEGSDIDVSAHEHDKFPLHELTSTFEHSSYHEVTISASKIIEKVSNKDPCYTGE